MNLFEFIVAQNFQDVSEGSPKSPTTGGDGEFGLKEYVTCAYYQPTSFKAPMGMSFACANTEEPAAFMMLIEAIFALDSA